MSILNQGRVNWLYCQFSIKGNHGTQNPDDGKCSNPKTTKFPLENLPCDFKLNVSNLKVIECTLFFDFIFGICPTNFIPWPIISSELRTVDTKHSMYVKTISTVAVIMWKVTKLDTGRRSVCEFLTPVGSMDTS
jgi:hypothetical protein